jgi:predicted N-acetyltransferase YhbS
MDKIDFPRPLSQSDDREAFDCGRESMNLWFRRHGWRNHASGMSRISVIVDGFSGVVVGYVSLSAAQIEREVLPRADQRNRPDPVPVILLGRLAVDLRYTGKGHAASLLFHALKTAMQVSRDIGCFGVVTHPLDDGVRSFYTRFGFVDLPFDPKRSMIVRIVDLEFNGFG